MPEQGINASSQPPQVSGEAIAVPCCNAHSRSNSNKASTPTSTATANINSILDQYDGSTSSPNTSSSNIRPSTSVNEATTITETSATSSQRMVRSSRSRRPRATPTRARRAETIRITPPTPPRRASTPPLRPAEWNERSEDSDGDLNLWPFWRIWTVVKVLATLVLICVCTYAVIRDQRQGGGCDPQFRTYHLVHIGFMAAQLLATLTLLYNLPSGSQPWTYEIYQSATILLGQMCLVPIGFILVKFPSNACVLSSYLYEFTYYLILVQCILLILLSLPTVLLPCAISIAFAPSHHGVPDTSFHSIVTITYTGVTDFTASLQETMAPTSTPKKLTSPSISEMVSEQEDEYITFDGNTIIMPDGTRLDSSMNVCSRNEMGADAIEMADVAPSAEPSESLTTTSVEMPQGQTLSRARPYQRNAERDIVAGPSTSLMVEVSQSYRRSLEAQGRSEAAGEEGQASVKKPETAVTAKPKWSFGTAGSATTSASTKPITKPVTAPINKLKSECCSICLEAWAIGSKVSILDCRHAFHTECIKIWFVEHSDCRF
ncbi:hypothetical protein HDU67_000438 [Dinochytrium kinnereticum]|nr:hypothetical protein HDU67_000438 [Dinochytrium kinnereticum]